MSLHQFNPGKKSWKMYANTITSISGDHLTLSPCDGQDLILEVSGNNDIIFKKGDTSYNLADLTNSSLTNYDDASLGNVDISGEVIFKGNITTGSGSFKLNCENNSHGVTIKGPPHNASANYTLTLPNTDGDVDQVLKTDGSGNLSWVNQSGGSINNSFTELVSINTSSSSSTWDGTTTLLNQISTTNLRHFGHSSKITKDGQFAFIGEVSTSLNGAIIHIYQKNSVNGTYSTYSTQSSISIDDFADHDNHAARCHGFDISEDGSIIVVLHNNLIEDSNMTSIYAIIYYYDSTSSTWVLTSQTSNATKRSNNTIRGILLGNLTPTNTSGSSHPVHRLLNTRIKFLSKDGTKLAIHIANGGTSYSTGLVAVYTITINGINTTINTNGTSGSRALVNIVPPAGSNISFSYHYSPAAIANNGYVLVTGIDQDAINAGNSGFTALLYSTDIANNSSTLVWKFLTPLMDSNSNEAGTGCYIDNKYFSFSDPYVDNPGNATNNYGATWVFDYTDRISSSASTETWNQTATNPEVVLLSDGTLTSHSFYVSDTNNGYGGHSQCQIREYASDLYIILGSSIAYGADRGTVEIWKYSNSSWTNTSELTYDSGKGTSVYYGNHVGLADDTILVAAPGGWSGQYGSNRYVEFHSLNLTTTTTTTTGQITGNTKIVGNLEVTGNVKLNNSNVIYTETSKDYIFKNSIISTETLNGSFRILQTDANNEFVIVSYPNYGGHYLYSRFDNVRRFMNTRGNSANAASHRIGQAHISDRGTAGNVEVIIGDAEHDTRGSLHFYNYHKSSRSYSYDRVLQSTGIHFGNYDGFGSVLHGTEDNTTLFMIGDNTNTKYVLAFTRHPDKTWANSFGYLLYDVGFHHYSKHIVIPQRDMTGVTLTSYDRDNYYSYPSAGTSTARRLSAFKWISSSRDGEFLVLNNPLLQQLYVFKTPEYMYTLSDSTQTNNVTQITSGYTVNDYTIVQVMNAEDFHSSIVSTPSAPQYYYGPCNSGASIEGTIASHTINYTKFSSQNDLLFGGGEEYNKVISPNGKVLTLIDSGYKNSNATVYGDSNDYVVGIIVILERSSTEDSNGNYVNFTYSQHFIGEFYPGVSSTSAVTTQFGEYVSVNNDSIIASSGNSSLSQDQNKMYYITKNESGTWTVDNIPGPPYYSNPQRRQIFANYDHSSIVTWSGQHTGANMPTYFYKDYNKSKVASYNGEFTNVTANLLNTAYAPVVTSDDRYKINEEVLNNGLESIRQLVPKRYLKTNKEYEADYTGNLQFGDKGILETGLIAQEVNNIENLSYLVKYDTINNKYSLCYNDLFVYNIEATKELDVIVTQQQDLIKNLLQRIETLESKLAQ